MNPVPPVLNPAPPVMNPASPVVIAVPPVVKPGMNPVSNHVSLFNQAQHGSNQALPPGVTLPRQPLVVRKVVLRPPDAPAQVPKNREIIGWKRLPDGSQAPILVLGKRPRLADGGDDSVGAAKDNASTESAPSFVIKQEDGENPIKIFVKE